MTQHELLMLVAAPLLVFGQPMFVRCGVCLRGGVSPRTAGRAGPGVVRGWRGLTSPMTAFALHGTVLWLWHVPVRTRRRSPTPALVFILVGLALFAAWLVGIRTARRLGSVGIDPEKVR